MLALEKSAVEKYDLSSQYTRSEQYTPLIVPSYSSTGLKYVRQLREGVATQICIF